MPSTKDWGTTKSELATTDRVPRQQHETADDYTGVIPNRDDGWRFRVNDFGTELGRDFGASDKKNPGALAGATGVRDGETFYNSQRENTAKRGRSAMSLYAKPGHKSVARMVGYTLTLGTADAFADLAYVLHRRLDPKERAGLAYAALRSLDPELAELVAETVGKWGAA